MTRLDPCDCHSVRSWRRAGRSDNDIAAALGVSVAAVRAVGVDGSYGYVPSPTEIKRSMAAVRATWTDDTRLDRKRYTPAASRTDFDTIAADAEVQLEHKLVAIRDALAGAA